MRPRGGGYDYRRGRGGGERKGRREMRKTWMNVRVGEGTYRTGRRKKGDRTTKGDCVSTGGWKERRERERKRRGM
jgi:hypothetical protein